MKIEEIRSLLMRFASQRAKEEKYVFDKKSHHVNKKHGAIRNILAQVNFCKNCIYISTWKSLVRSIETDLILLLPEKPTPNQVKPKEIINLIKFAHEK